LPRTRQTESLSPELGPIKRPRSHSRRPLATRSRSDWSRRGLATQGIDARLNLMAGSAKLFFQCRLISFRTMSHRLAKLFALLPKIGLRRTWLRNQVVEHAWLCPWRIRQVAINHIASRQRPTLRLGPRRIRETGQVFIRIKPIERIVLD